MTSKRKPYTREITSSWWKHSKFYRHYMLREATAIASVWFALLLICFLYSVLSTFSNPEFLSTPDENLPLFKFLLFLSHPVTTFINSLALMASLFHTATWFNVAPKATRLIIKGKKIPDKAIVCILWATMISASVAISLLALFNPL